MADHKPPTPQGISALLGEAGFVQSLSSQLGGWTAHSEGYSAAEWGPGHVVVIYHRGARTREEFDRIRPDMLSRYAAAITDAGYVAAEARGHLAVTAPKTEDQP